MSQPLFVLGKQRSGTTWLANQLSQHSQIAAVRDDHHGGVHESAFFSHVAGRYGSLAYRTNYTEFAEVMAASDTLRMLGIDKRFLYGLWPTTYAGVFRAVMDRAACKKGARYWLDKTPEHTLMINQIAAHYPDARFVALVRDALGVMRSNMGRYHGLPWRRRTALVRGTLNLVHYTKEIKHFSRRSDRIRVVQFGDLLEQPERTFQDLCAFLELEFEPAMLQQAYAPNTTFDEANARERTTVLSPVDHRLVRLAQALGRAVPVSGFRAVRRVAGARAKSPLPRWFFSLYSPEGEEPGGGRSAWREAAQGREPAGLTPER